MSMHLILTVIAPDRPGLVETLARIISSNGGNWVDSRMARMAGQFAGILRVDIAGDRLPALRRELEALAGQHISVQLAVSEPETDPSQQQLVLTLVGNDRPGIVHEVSAILSRHGVNVE